MLSMIYTHTKNPLTDVRHLALEFLLRYCFSTVKLHPHVTIVSKELLPGVPNRLLSLMSR